MNPYRELTYIHSVFNELSALKIGETNRDFACLDPFSDIEPSTERVRSAISKAASEMSARFTTRLIDGKLNVKRIA